MDDGTDALRKLAPCWSLAGDDRLLTILQNTHQRLLARCEVANCQLEQMTTALNDASINLQNVNNQFMALSSSQFIESRVYDDDDSTEVPEVKEPPKPDVPDIPDELTSLKRSISVLENTHEEITILHDSDTDTDTDDDVPARLVLKPKDVYADRPLPYIIGSEPWKNKWHAGLLHEDSDSDSTTSKVDHNSEQYSQSEPEDNIDKHPVFYAQDTTVSETSSELPSDQGSVPKPTPSDVASEIARRLGAREPPKVVEREPEYEEPAKPTVRKIYRPQDPVTSTIFPDEPPPLSDHTDSESDIFADLHRNQPYARTHPTDDLFGFTRKDSESDEGDIFSDFAKPVTDPSAKPVSLFDAGPTPHMFDKQRITPPQQAPSERKEHTYDAPQENKKERTADEPDRTLKKPAGGISLFGNKGTESIGAAILNRNQRKSSTSGEDSGSDAQEQQTHTKQIRKEKDIFDDLFARSEVKEVTKHKVDIVKDIKAEIKKKNEEKVKDKVEKPKVDLFSDNLFDDIDDIFSTNVVKMPSKDNVKAKSIFEDEDDLFSEIAAPKTTKTEAMSSNNKKGLFDSDDELFSDSLTKPKLTDYPNNIKHFTEVEKVTGVVESVTNNNKTPNISKETAKSLFDDDEDDIFSDLKVTNNVTRIQNTVVKYNDITEKDAQTNKNTDPQKSANVFKSPSLFDEDDDTDSDIFANSQSIQQATSVHTETLSKTQVTVTTEKLANKPEIRETLSVYAEKAFVTPVIEKLDKTDHATANSAKIDDFEQCLVKEDNNLNEEGIVNESKVNKIMDSIVFSNNSSHESNNSVLNISDNVDRENSKFDTNAGETFEHIKKNVEQTSSDTNDHLSDQDFDDLPPKIEGRNNTNLNFVTEIKKIDENIGDKIIFDIKTLEDGIFIKSNEKEEIKDDVFAKVIEKPEPPDAIFNNAVPSFSETISKDIEKTEHDNKTNQLITKAIEEDIFSDIISEPPAFEKPKEPKKSKNVNALFDDDSDDESLFFKKNDVIPDEKPEDFKPTQDRLFGLFTDEPPDDGFSKISDDFDDDLFSMLPKPKLPQNENLPPLPDTVDSEDSIPILKSANEVPFEHSTKEVFPDLSKSDLLLPTETPKAPTLGKSNSQEDSLKLPHIENTYEKVISKAVKTETATKVLVEDELLKASKIETNISNKQEYFYTKSDINTSVPNKQLDILSDDDELYSPLSSDERHTAPTLIYKKEVPVTENKNQELINKTENVFSTTTKSEILKKEIEKLESDEDRFKIPQNKTDSDIDQRSTSKSSEKSEPRKVGKLKVGLNINVNALLPGASPKKIVAPKINDQIDGQIHSVIENKNTEYKIPETPNTATEIIKKESYAPEDQTPDSKLLKSVSFDGKPDSEILDNKLSKERAKIQVKRRPSTRRARREAVKKSGIDFGEDSTDNSSSIDDPPRIQPEKQPETLKKDNIEKDSCKNLELEVRDDIPTESIEKYKIPANTEDSDKYIQVESQPEKVESHPEKVESQPEKVESQLEKVESQPEKVETRPATIEKPSFSKDVKSKVVYILNDEDIFNTIPTENFQKDRTTTILKPDFSAQNIDSNAHVSTSGKATKGDKKDNKPSLFGDDDDDEIFKGKNEKQKTNIFDSDSEEELFGTSKKEKKEIKKEVVKGSLFGDEDDDDDLFGVKTKKSVESKPQPSRPTVKETPKSTEPVFEDPLSMFGDDD